jgi:hypothetical protein
MFQRTLEVQREDRVDPKEMQMWHLLGFLQCHGELCHLFGIQIFSKSINWAMNMIVVEDMDKLYVYKSARKQCGLHMGLNLHC